MLPNSPAFSNLPGVSGSACSRNWLRVLSSPEVLKTLTLKAWFGISNTSLSTSQSFFQGVCTLSSDLSPGAEILLRAKHIDSLRNGTAFSMARRKWPKNGHQFAGIDFAGSILAWRDPQVGCIILECVVSGRSISLFTPPREEISQIAISDTTLVALSVSGSCYAWDLSGGIQEVEGQSPECIETHVEEWQMMSVSGKTVVTCCCDYNKEMMNFTTWNIQGHQWHQFRMQLDEPGFDPRYYDYFVLITPGGASFVFFEAVSTKTQFTRMDLNGQVEASGFIHHPEIEGYSMHSKYGTAVCTASCVTIWSYARSWEVLDAQLTRSHALEVMRVVYDTKTDRLEVQRNVVKHSVETDFNAKDLVWWNDVAYFWKYAGETEELHVLDLKASICKRAEMCVPETLVRHNYRFFEESFGLFPILLFGKESLLISIRYVHLLVGLRHSLHRSQNFEPRYLTQRFCIGVSNILSGASKT